MYKRIAAAWLASKHGGKSTPLVTLVDVNMSDSGVVEQEWEVYANGQKVSVKSVTDKNGDTKVGGRDLDLGVHGLTAQKAIAFILQGSHPRYYPKPGRTVKLDEQFVIEAGRSLMSH
jgi:hypothetical protein